MKYGALTLLLLSKISVVYGTILKEFNSSLLAPNERMHSYFSDNPLRGYLVRMQEYKLILDTEEEGGSEALRELEALGQKSKFSFPRNTELIDLTPLAKKLYPKISFDNIAAFDSINCLNTSLLLEGFLERQSFTIASEFEFYMDNFCEEVTQVSKKTISYYPYGMAKHSRTNITRNLGFEKPSNGKEASYRFTYKASTKRYKIYECRSDKFQNLACPELKSINQKLNSIDNFYTTFIKSLRNSLDRPKEFKKLKSLKQEIKNKDLYSFDCRIKRESMLQRIYSLESLNEEVDARGVNGDNNGFISPKF